MKRNGGVQTIKEQIYTLIRDKILSGHFRPGERINEVDLASSLSVSRTPVRDALNELAGEGLVESLPNRGMAVRVLTEKDIHEIFDIRCLFEEYAIRQAVLVADERELQELGRVYARLQEHLESGNVLQYTRADADFHDLIIRMSGNGLASRIMGTVASMLHPFRALALISEARFRQSLIEHKGIHDTLCQRDAESAVQWNNTHLVLARDQVLANLQNYVK